MLSPTVDDFVSGIRASDRAWLGRGITLVESRREQDRSQAALVLERLQPFTGKSLRIGITGVPGVGKSTLIESLGKTVVAEGKKLAILAVDPTSPLTHGSILGDKTRMESLSKNPAVFIRPSPSGLEPGGVALSTRESMHLCEAAGFDVVFIETVGVGQSEMAVRDIVDYFLLLQLAGAGDGLQGIKKGILEMADGIAFTKSDGLNVEPTRLACEELRQALRFSAPPVSPGRVVEVMSCSALDEKSMVALWKKVKAYLTESQSNGYFQRQREQQEVQWIQRYAAQQVRDGLQRFLESYEGYPALENEVRQNRMSPREAAAKALESFYLSQKPQ